MAIDRHRDAGAGPGHPRPRTSARSTSASASCWPRPRPSAACSARSPRASTAARCGSTSRASSTSSPRATCGAPRSRSSTTTPCPASPVASAPRRASARAAACAARRASRWPSARSSGSWPTGRCSTATELPHTVHPPSGKRVAIVGSGPAGLTAAGELVKTGHHVTIFEAFHAAGGVLIYGIPEFRLPKDIVQAEVDRLKAAGVEIEVNAIVGKTWTLRELRTMFDAVFIAVGAGLPVFMDVPGENLKGVYSANEYLTRVNLMGAYPGGRGHAGAPRPARGRGRRRQRRHGLRPHGAAPGRRRGDHRLPPRPRRAAGAARGGPPRRAGGRPVRAPGRRPSRSSATSRLGAGAALRAHGAGRAGRLGPPAPEPVPGSEFEIPCEMVVVAIGTRSNPLLTASEPDLAVNEWGYLVVDEDGMTSLPGVFAGGDIVRGAATVILAMGDGKRAAGAIERYLVRVAEMAEGAEAGCGQLKQADPTAAPTRRARPEASRRGRRTCCRCPSQELRGQGVRLHEADDASVRQRSSTEPASSIDDLAHARSHDCHVRVRSADPGPATAGTRRKRPPVAPARPSPAL